MSVCALAFIFLWIIFGDLRSWIVLLTSKLWVEMWRINLSPLWKSGFVFNAWLSGMMVLMEPLRTIVLYCTCSRRHCNGAILYNLLEMYFDCGFRIVLWRWGVSCSPASTQCLRYNAAGRTLVCVWLFTETVERCKLCDSYETVYRLLRVQIQLFGLVIVLGICYLTIWIHVLCVWTLLDFPFLLVTLNNICLTCATSCSVLSKVNMIYPLRTLNILHFIENPLVIEVFR